MILGIETNNILKIRTAGISIILTAIPKVQKRCFSRYFIKYFIINNNNFKFYYIFIKRVELYLTSEDGLHFNVGIRIYTYDIY